MLEFQAVKTEDSIVKLCALAAKIWHEYYASIISQQQIDYMIAKFFSVDALKTAIHADGYVYYLVTQEKEEVGFIGAHQEEKRLFLSKLYLSDHARGKGYATQMFAFLVTLYKAKGVTEIYLTCNKRNTTSFEIYHHWGFECTDSVEMDIGQGYVMDDFVMVKQI